MEEKLATVIETQRDKQLQLIASLKQYYHAENGQAEEEVKLQKELFDSEIESLVKVIKIKDNEAQRNMIFKETERVEAKLILENLENENSELKKKISWMRKKEV